MKRRQNPFIQFRSLAMIVLVAGLILAGCTSPAAAPTPVPPTATLAPSSTPTSLPTNTPTSTATPDQTATLVAYATAQIEEKLSQIAPELEKLGYAVDSGRLIYFKTSAVDVTADSYMEDVPKLIVEDPVKDFILQADIGWNSTSGLAGCGLILRAEADLERGAQYQYYMLRLSGSPAWDVAYYRYGTYQYSLLTDMQFTAAIDERQDAVNTITLVVKGDTIESTINTTKSMDAVDKKLTEGQIALLAWQESGKTTCTFSNVWVWELNP